MKTWTVSALALAAAAACAPKPDDIPAASVRAAPYGALSCPQAARDRAVTQVRLDDLSAAQEKAAAADAAGVFLFGVPGASLAGKDRSGEIAFLKGQVAALDERLEDCR